jgi:hypothetical protein
VRINGRPRERFLLLAARRNLTVCKMSPAERLRASILKSMGLTEQQLDQMPPAQRQAVEQKIEEIIKQKLQQNGGQPGQLVNAST